MRPTEDQVVHELQDRTSPSAESMAALHRRLESGAERDGMLDVAYRTLDTAVGSLLLAATPTGLVRIAYAVQGHEAALEALAAAVSPRILEAPGRLDDAAREIEEYLAGGRRTFDLPLDFALSHGFRQTVQRFLPTIGYGQTYSYTRVAAEVGNPKAVRAVGSACATNPLPLVVPCHRVLPASGSVGRYAGGAEAKSVLLAMERTTTGR
ncbi:methylated-DNA--[protein]-cysteine S-methyltransferase [Leekyejoonella antrihumi]|uniref:methylated-DNA--[protein]-cysteine S-methyltransferase n=1 Tax=Leekyejoonella antrihumi TaxID=1660198 RepID=A0A563E940_9MICO|nr:methylated-DNA--[protein]-cysteine S-methyltransferase [Leekyejoonella antrihumi]TWP39036.1 methylated-DNA--[protein]-cysteine S-methyltransferase [Leekyejoonella antrihumi]